MNVAGYFSIMAVTRQLTSPIVYNHCDMCCHWHHKLEHIRQYKPLDIAMETTLRASIINVHIKCSYVCNNISDARGWFSLLIFPMHLISLILFRFFFKYLMISIEKFVPSNHHFDLNWLLLFSLNSLLFAVYQFLYKTWQLISKCYFMNNIIIKRHVQTCYRKLTMIWNCYFLIPFECKPN